MRAGVRAPARSEDSISFAQWSTTAPGPARSRLKPPTRRNALRRTANARVGSVSGSDDVTLRLMLPVRIHKDIGRYGHHGRVPVVQPRSKFPAHRAGIVLEKHQPLRPCVREVSATVERRPPLWLGTPQRSQFHAVAQPRRADKALLGCIVNDNHLAHLIGTVGVGNVAQQLLHPLRAVACTDEVRNHPVLSDIHRAEGENCLSAARPQGIPCCVRTMYGSW